MNWKAYDLYIWIFRVLVLLSGAIMVVSFTQPWWTGAIGNGAINVYGWGLRHNISGLLIQYISDDITPTWQISLAWVYIAVSIAVAIVGTFIKKWWGSLLIAISGIGYIAYAYTAMNTVISNRLATSNIALEGYTAIGGSFGITIIANIESAYYLAYIAGGMLLLLAIIWLFVAIARSLLNKSKLHVNNTP